MITHPTSTSPKPQSHNCEIEIPNIPGTTISKYDIRKKNGKSCRIHHNKNQKSGIEHQTHAEIEETPQNHKLSNKLSNKYPTYKVNKETQDDTQQQKWEYLPLLGLGAILAPIAKQDPKGETGGLQGSPWDHPSWRPSWTQDEPSWDQMAPKLATWSTCAFIFVSMCVQGPISSPSEAHLSRKCSQNVPNMQGPRATKCLHC